MENEKRLLTIVGSPRESGNSEIIARQIVQGFSVHDSHIQMLRVKDLNIQPCSGCLRCNWKGRCQTHDDQWEDFLQHFKSASHIVVASPIYFHHLPGSFKVLLDRFRSQIQIKMTHTGLLHRPYWQQRKKYAFVFSLGDRSDHDVQPAIRNLTYLAKIFGSQDEDIQIIIGKGLAVRRQISLSPQRLEKLYQKLGLPSTLVQTDYKTNQTILHQAFHLGRKWAEE